MQENRSLLKYYLLTLVTCGIYGLYVYHTLARDINIICEGDGSEKPTPGLLPLILLSLVTCGIYSYVWHFRFMRRMEQNAARYQIPVKSVGNMELGPCYLVLTLGGILVSACGIGLIMVIYAQYLMFANLNELSKAYNRYQAEASY